MSNLFLLWSCSKASHLGRYLNIIFWISISCACLFVCLFVYFTLVLKMMMMMKLSLFLLFWLNVRWYMWLKILSKLNFLKNVTFHLHLNTVWQKFEFDNLKIDFRPYQKVLHLGWVQSSVPLTNIVADNLIFLTISLTRIRNYIFDLRK